MLRPQRRVRVFPSREANTFSLGSFRAISQKIFPLTTHSPGSSTAAGTTHSFWSIRSEHFILTPFASAQI